MLFFLRLYIRFEPQLTQGFAFMRNYGPTDNQTNPNLMKLMSTMAFALWELINLDQNNLINKAP
jgi:hypothetical protein